MWEERVVQGTREKKRASFGLVMGKTGTSTEEWLQKAV